MFSTLIDSEPTRRSALSPSTWGFSTVVHVLLVVAIVGLAGQQTEAAPASGSRDVTYVDIAEVEERVQPEPAEPGAQQPDPLPEAEPEAAGPAMDEAPADQLAGFQELRVPEEVSGIPEPPPAAAAVRAQDFRGRGVVGGIGGGLPPLRSQLQSGSGGGASSGVSRLPPPPPDVVEVNARILNAGELQPQIRRLYPSNYRAAGIEGRVVAQFAVGVDGRVDPGSILIVEASHAGFEEPTRALLLLLRWQPARRDGRSVASWARMPVMWTIR